MDDALLVSRAMAGDLDSFGQLYDRYFNRIYDYTWRVLRDAPEAAEVTRQVFERAARELAAAKRSTSVKAWLFSLAHAAAVNRAASMPQTPAVAHEEAFGTFDVPDPASVTDRSLARDDPEYPALVWEAAASLSARDYALLDLHERQMLDAAELASAIGVGRREAQALTERMKSAADETLGGYILARRGECEALERELAALPVPPNAPEARGAIAAHVRSCERCGDLRARIVPPLTVFAALAPVQSPFALKGDLWRDLVASWRGDDAPSAQPAVAAVGLAGAAPPPPSFAMTDAGGSSGGGYGTIALPASDGDSSRNRILIFAAAAVGLLVFAFAGGAFIAGGFGGDGDGGGSPIEATLTADDAGGPSNTPGVSVETPTPGDATETATPAPTDTPAPSATAEPPTAIPPTATNTLVPTQTQRPTRTPTATRTVRPTQTVRPTRTPNTD